MSTCEIWGKLSAHRVYPEKQTFGENKNLNLHLNDWAWNQFPHGHFSTLLVCQQFVTIIPSVTLIWRNTFEIATSPGFCKYVCTNVVQRTIARFGLLSILKVTYQTVLKVDMIGTISARKRIEHFDCPVVGQEHFQLWNTLASCERESGRNPFPIPSFTACPY